MFFFVKVRIDINKMEEFGQKIQNGEIKTHPLSTYCLADDPSVGLNIWEAQDRKSFDEAFSFHRDFYQEIIEISQVILPQSAMKILSQQKR